MVYDPYILSYEDILDHFISELGGPPVSAAYSRQYRAAILVHNSDQMISAKAKVAELSKKFSNRKMYIDVEEATSFYRAEEYHQKFYEKQKGSKKQGIHNK